MSGHTLDTARRRAARWSSYGSLVVTAALAWLMLTLLQDRFAIESGWANIDFASLEEVALLQEYLRIDTTHETGSELEGARFLANVLQREGIPVEVIDMGGGGANLIAVLEGDQPEALILHNHIDLDPIHDPEAWTYPPFSATIEPPWIYARGAFDMKSVAIAQLLAMVELRRQGISPRRTVIFLATGSEEIGSDLGSSWLIHQRPELFANAWGLLTEGGVLEARGLDDIKYWGTEHAQKYLVRVTACAPTLERLEALLIDVSQADSREEGLRLTPLTRDFLRSYVDSRDNPLHRELLADPARLLRDREAFALIPPFIRGLFHDQAFPFPPQPDRDGGSGYEMHINLSLLEDADVEVAVDNALPQWMTAGVHLIVEPEESASGGSDLQHPLFKAIEKTLHERFGEEAKLGPYYQGRSATDARFFRALGVASYGFTPFFAFTTDTVGIGGANEGLALPAFIDGVELYKQLLFELVAPTER
jgi:acetylornithine deacetylase/succinyl-diaminopimelate desuccinylase-like protein